MNQYEHFERKLILEISKLDKKSMNKTNDILVSKYRIFFVRVPLVRKLHPKWFNELSLEEQFDLCVEFFRTTMISEVATWALAKIEKMPLKFLMEKKKELLLLSYTIENWWHCDHLSSIYAQLLDKQKLLLKDFQDWTKTGNFWQQRLSLTSLLYYSTLRKNPLQSQTILAQVKLLLEHSNYYVQKGVGWTLRECYNLYPVDTFEFIRVYAKKISAAAFSPAIEKMSQEEKDELKQLRKKGVSNPYYFENAY